MRAWLGQLALRVHPDLFQSRWRKEQLRIAAQALSSVAYAPLMSHPIRTSQSPAESGRPTHVVVVPYEGEGFDSFRPGTRNFYYEAAQNLAENIGAEHVSFFSVRRDEPVSQWQVRLADYVLQVRATHLLTHIEADPGSEGEEWHWEIWWKGMAERWDGVLLGVMFDSAFEWITAKSRLLARISPRFLAVDICMPLDGQLVRGRPEVGPVNMPVSRESLDLVQRRIAGIEPSHDVSFIGALYPYRVQMLDRLRALGVRVIVNPHRSDSTADFHESRANQPSWLDYMAGLAGSHMTINFSRSSAGPFEQLKTRVLEATLAGTVLLTDDKDRTRLFFEPEREFVSFTSLDDLPRVVAELLADPQRLASIKSAGAKRAKALAHVNFWDGIQGGLRARHLPLIWTDRPI